MAKQKHIDDIGFETPGSVTRKIETLDSAWQALGASYPDDKALTAEIGRWQVWRDKILASFTSRLFPSTIADEFASWQSRYQLAFENAQNAAPNVTPTAPMPKAIVGPSPVTSPWVYAVVAGSVALGLLALAWMKK